VNLRRNMEKIHGINLLQTLSITLNQEEVDHNRSDEITSCKDIAVCEADSIRDKRSEECEVEVPELLPLISTYSSDKYKRGKDKRTQLLAEQYEIACDLYLPGYISATQAHAIGPHVDAKAAMNKHANIIIT